MLTHEYRITKYLARRNLRILDIKDGQPEMTGCLDRASFQSRPYSSLEQSRCASGNLACTNPHRVRNNKKKQISIEGSVQLLYSLGIFTF